MNQPLRPPATPTPNWWKRNWKWFVPLGCFTVALLFVIFVGSILVIEALGSPIKDGFLMSGNTNVNGAAGEANLAIPISGPKGKATIYVSAKKSLGRWNYSGLVVEIGQTHQRIDLLQSPAPTSSP